MLRLRRTVSGLFIGLIEISAYAQTQNPVVPIPAPVHYVDENSFVRLGKVTASLSLPNGILVHAGAAAMRVEALRDDLLRVRVTPNGKWQENASWAVLPEHLTSGVSVTPSTSTGVPGFSTKSLAVSIERDPMRLVVKDLNGNIITEDAVGRPAQFTGKRDNQGGEFRVWKSMPDDEHFFGLGDKTGPLDRRNEAFVDWNKDAYLFQESTDPIYKSIPFFLAETGGRYHGIFLDNTWRASFDFGKEQRNAYSFGSEGGPLDYYILYGPDPKHVVEAYAWLTGPPPLPPLWSFGFQQSRFSYTPDSAVRAVAERLRNDKIPCDVLWLDIDYQDENRPFTIDPLTFPEMPKLVADMKAKQFHMVAITDLHIAYQPDKGYAPYDNGLAADAYVKNPNGSTYIGASWPGKVVFPEFTQAKSREWWGTNFKQFVDMGFAGFWNDMNEPSIRNEPQHTMPLDTVHRIAGTGFAGRTTTHREVHNIFGMQNARGTYEGVLKLSPNERPYVMTRATYAGGQRFSVTWTGDNAATWNHLRMTTSMLENLGLSGYTFAGADVGGHIGSPSADLLTKWVELSAFQPIDRDHSNKQSLPQELWVHGPEQEAVRRRFIETRYRLMPYIYTIAEEASRNGLPMVRPLFLEFPNEAKDGHPVDLDSTGEFLWGPDLLVAAPAYFEMQSKYTPLLPGDTWYDFWSGIRVAKKRSSRDVATDATEFARTKHIPPSPGVQPNRAVGLTSGTVANLITPSVDELPVYVRGGSILPMQSLVQSTQEKPAGPLELRVYPGPRCEGSLYTDDGHTLNYKRGDYLRVTYTCALQKEGLAVHIGPREGSFAPWWSQVEVVVFGWQATSGRAELSDDHHSLPVSYDAAAQALHVVVPETLEGTNILFTN